MLTLERVSAFRAELRELQSKSSYTVDDLARIDEIGQVDREAEWRSVAPLDHDRRAQNERSWCPGPIPALRVRPPTGRTPSASAWVRPALGTRDRGEV